MTFSDITVPNLINSLKSRFLFLWWWYGVVVVVQSSLPILPLPPNTAAHFKSQIGFFKVILPPNTAVSEYCRFFASPKNGGIGGNDCSTKSLVWPKGQSPQSSLGFNIGSLNLYNVRRRIVTTALAGCQGISTANVRHLGLLVTVVG